METIVRIENRREKVMPRKPKYSVVGIERVYDYLKRRPITTVFYRKPRKEPPLKERRGYGGTKTVKVFSTEWFGIKKGGKK